jgi:hypothetical protein
MDDGWLLTIGLIALGATASFLLMRKRWGTWLAAICSPLMGFGIVGLADNALELVTTRDCWGPAPRERFESNSRRTQAVDGALVTIGDWNDDGAPEQVRCRWVPTPHFHSHTTHSRIEVLSGVDGRVLGTIDFHLPLAAVPHAIGDRDGDGIEELAVDYEGTTFVWGRESFL